MRNSPLPLEPVKVRKKAGRASSVHLDRKKALKKGYHKHKNRRFS